jgi:hypothetical protein
MKTITTAILVCVWILIGTACHKNTAPAIPGAPVGPDVGMVGDSLSFLVATTDPDSDSVRYRVDWGDALGDWSELLASGESCAVGHRWSVRDTYAIQVQAKDAHDLASEWSASLVVSIESLCRR